MKRKAYSYSRLSTEKQIHGQGLERQTEAIKKYVSDNNLELIENFEDIGISGYTGANKKIGKFGVFIRAIEDGEIDSNCTLIVESLDRISRENILTAQSQFLNLISIGVEIVTLMDQQKYNREIINEAPHLLFVSMGIMIRANEESEIKSKRLKSAWEKKRRAADIKIITRKAPAWLKVENNKFVEVGSSFKTIKKIFELCTTGGMGTLAITKYLNKHSSIYPAFSKSQKWTKSYVTKILKSPSVYGQHQSFIKLNGKRIPDGKPLNDYFPAIVSKNKFELAQQNMMARSVGGGGRHPTNYKNIFHKLLKCDHCDDTIGFFNKGPGSQQYLQCYSSVYNNGCFAQSVRYDEFEKLFLTFMNEIDWNTVLTDSEWIKKGENIREILAGFRLELSQEKEVFDDLLRKLLKIDEDEISDYEIVKKEQKLKIINIENEIEELEASLQKFSYLEQQNNANNVQDLVRKIATSSEGRFKLNNYLRSVLDTIKINNIHFKVEPWEIDPIAGIEDNHDIRLIKILRKRMSNEEVQKYLLDEKNKSNISKLYMHFFVKFKNNAHKEVYPYFDFEFTRDKENLKSIISQDRRLS